MVDPLGLFLKDLLVENNANTMNVTIAFDNASPELPLKALLRSNNNNNDDNESFNCYFPGGKHSTSSLDSMMSTDSRSSRWDSMPNLGGNSSNNSSKAKREGIPSLPRRTSEKEPVMLELLALAKARLPTHDRVE